jgi:DNA excision repair protein ERCC-3
LLDTGIFNQIRPYLQSIFIEYLYFQISSHFGSRRQEAQRLGRILRAKRNAVGSNGPNAFFYTLVSKDTEEVYYSSKRQQFLIDQGYSFKIITQLEGMDDGGAGDLIYSTLPERLELLTTILVTNDDHLSDLEDADEVDLDSGGEDEDNDVIVPTKVAKQAKRQRGTMQSLSGADSMAYLELPRVSVDKERGRRSYRSR